MNGRYAQLTALRYNSVAREGVGRVTRYLVSALFPIISRHAQQGAMLCTVAGPIDDDAKEALEKLDYVVRRKELYTEICWGPQTVINDLGKPERLSCKAYNVLVRMNQLRNQPLIPSIVEMDPINQSTL